MHVIHRRHFAATIDTTVLWCKCRDRGESPLEHLTQSARSCGTGRAAQWRCVRRSGKARLDGRVTECGGLSLVLLQGSYGSHIMSVRIADATFRSHPVILVDAIWEPWAPGVGMVSRARRGDFGRRVEHGGLRMCIILHDGVSHARHNQWPMSAAVGLLTLGLPCSVASGRRAINRDHDKHR